MSIRVRILLFQLIVALAVVGTAATVHVVVRESARYLQRVTWAHQELETMMELAVHANRYSEQIAEMLLIGEPERPDLESARGQMLEGFRRLERLIDEEIAFVHDPAEQERERRELDRLARMRALYREIDGSLERLLFLSREGRDEGAVALFRAEIENRLDAEFERLVAAGVAGERAEVVAAEEEAERLSRRLRIGAVSASVALLGASLGAGLLLARSLARPIAALTEGAAAIERGDLAHRIGGGGDDELGLLSRRFDAMAAEIARQRDLLLDARADLERQVERRTEQLAQANRRLLALDRLRLQFLAEISHELRTPLTVLRGEAEVTLRGRAPKGEELYRETLERIVAQAAEMARLVDDLLFLARSEAEQIRFELRRVGLAPILAEAVQEGSVLARRRGVRVVASASGPGVGVPLDADPQRLKQALVILLDNASKYSSPGQVVEVGPDPEAGNGWAGIVVRDRGAGVAPEDLPYVFDRFFRGRGAAASAAGGSGLGLPIAKWIVDKHGGTIELTSRPGEGTSVRVRLPRAPSPAASPPDGQVMATAEAGRGR